MSEQVKRYWLESFIDDFYKARQFVLASDFDALEQRCRELEEDNTTWESAFMRLAVCVGGVAQAKGKLQDNQSLEDAVSYMSGAIDERDTMRATLTAARDKLGPAVRNGHPALTEQAAAEVLAMLEAACADTTGDTPEA